MAELATAYRRGDNETVGRLLGYPACCRTFFEESWVRLRRMDVIWPAAWSSSSRSTVGPRHIAVRGPAASAMHLRWLGIRRVFHLPCAVDCAASQDWAEALGPLARDAGLDVDWAVTQDMLEWPARWSVLHGIAEIKCPVVKIIATSDATPEKYIVDYDAPGYPLEGATGLTFPYRQPTRRTVTDGVAFRRGLAQP